MLEGISGDHLVQLPKESRFNYRIIFHLTYLCSSATYGTSTKEQKHCLGQI